MRTLSLTLRVYKCRKSKMNLGDNKGKLKIMIDGFLHDHDLLGSLESNSMIIHVVSMGLVFVCSYFDAGVCTRVLNYHAWGLS